MKALIGALIFIVVGCGTVWSQSPNGAEARLKEKNIQLPSPSTPVANYVGAVRAVDRETQKSGVSTAPNWGCRYRSRTAQPREGHDAVSASMGSDPLAKADLRHCHLPTDQTGTGWIRCRSTVIGSSTIT